MKQLWTVARTNVKTGPITTSYVGESQDEARASCLGCPQLGDPTGDWSKETPTCYAWAGTVRRGANMVWNQSTLPQDLASAFKRAPDKRAVRMGAIGDPRRVEASRQEAAWARKQGAAVLAYTHHWREKGPVGDKDIFMASCDSWPDAKLALSMGWVPTVIVPQGTPKVVHTSTGHSFLRCPAETSKELGGHVTCGGCRMCDPTRLRKSRWAGIMFVFHGPRAPWTPQRRAAFEAKRLPVVGGAK